MCFKRCDVRVTSKIVGHADINTTYKIYTHVYENETLQFDALLHEKNLTRSEQDQMVILAQ